MIKDKIKEDSVKALKRGESKKVEILRFLLSLIEKRALKLPPGEMKDDDVLVVLQKELKNKKESKQMFEKALRDDLIKEVEYEIELLQSYLPEEISEEEIRMCVKKIVDESEELNFGIVMGRVMAELKGKAGGELVSGIVKEVMERK
ncbi:GatB/YqeY domain-containing protein [Patescibacteria group bacterium]|nr:GatB/YqeY domain-containing protein [Patescibacteria group bacterium]MCG2701541.1 GatB/YqeY domain-containing protein [Candidatus Parcubacteria bacterium]MBU4265256.1 GatB/YqeY domain-containing protein [Patescibacteria group bacterium]MBU4389941.1 GatB/YqeY domain-containing protein [Patescibacteria group bacterium]MBU4397605.1 GatB/YqeY domain-containing protein [Patescibacteria group bacterium]